MQKNITVYINSKWIQGSGFLLRGYGLFTNYHVTESGDFFNVYKYSEDDSIGIIGKEINEVKSCRNIDYALYRSTGEYDYGFELGDSTKLKLGEQITIIGYPNFLKGNSPMIQTCEITSSKHYLGSLFYTVGGRIVHGASGGVVLNQNRKVVGIIKGGIASLEGDDKNEKDAHLSVKVTTIL